MRKSIRALSVTTATLAAAFVMSPATPAFADITFTVTNGGIITGTNTPTDSLPHTIAHNITRGTSATCYDVEAQGNIADGPGQPGTEIAEVTSLRAGGYDGDPNFCEGPSGIGVSFQVSLPLYLNAESYASGVTTGKLTGLGGAGVTATMTADDGCEAIIDGIDSTAGTVGGTYTNSTHILETTAGGTNLEVSSTNGMCNNDLLQVGDDIALEGQISIDPAVQITSP